MYIGVNPTKEYRHPSFQIRFHFAGPAFALVEPGAVAVAWMGYDEPQSLGERESGGGLRCSFPARAF